MLWSQSSDDAWAQQVPAMKAMFVKSSTCVVHESPPPVPEKEEEGEEEEEEKEKEREGTGSPGESSAAATHMNNARRGIMDAPRAPASQLRGVSNYKA
jgi:hypothetical protein